MPLEAVEEENPDGGKTVWTGEVEPFGRMKGMAGITVDKGRSYIKAKVRVYNRTAFPQVFMWWANLAVPVNDGYRTVFPCHSEHAYLKGLKDEVLWHTKVWHKQFFSVFLTSTIGKE